MLDKLKTALNLKLSEAQDPKEIETLHAFLDEIESSESEFSDMRELTKRQAQTIKDSYTKIAIRREDDEAESESEADWESCLERSRKEKSK